MKTISIDVNAVNIQIEPTNVHCFNLMAEIYGNDISNILDSIDQETIAEYMRENGYIYTIFSLNKQ